MPLKTVAETKATTKKILQVAVSTLCTSRSVKKKLKGPQESTGFPNLRSPTRKTPYIDRGEAASLAATISAVCSRDGDSIPNFDIRLEIESEGSVDRLFTKQIARTRGACFSMLVSDCVLKN